MVRPSASPAPLPPLLPPCLPYTHLALLLFSFCDFILRFFLFHCLALFRFVSLGFT
jgi:hypothetical protein